MTQPPPLSPPRPTFQAVPPHGAPPPGWPAGAPPWQAPGPLPPAHLPREIPPELDRWNWGAFLLHWIWGIGNGTYIALLAWVPLGIFVMPFVLGARGNAWAWKNARWDSIAHFRRVQRLWAIWGLIVWAALLPLVAAVVGGVFYALGSSDPYRIAMSELNASSRATGVLGSPITGGWPTGSINVGPDTGSAEISFTATGPKGRGSVEVHARKGRDGWRLILLHLTPDGGSEPIDLLTERRAALGAAPATAIRR